MTTNRKRNRNNAVLTRKEEILDVAMKLFALKGYHVTTLDEVAKEIGVTKATIYYYFTGKEKIIREILQIGINRMKIIEELGKSSLPVIEKLRKFIRYHVEFSTHSAELARITFEQMNLLPERTRASIRRKQRVVDKTLQNIIQDGIDQGVFEVDDIKATSYAILGMCNWTYQWYQPDGRLTPDEISQTYIDLLEKGYLKGSQ